MSETQNKSGTGKIKTKVFDTGYRPRPLQTILHKSLKRFNVLVCHRRFGKCCIGSTPVLTTLGWKEIKDIKTGDYVFTPKGEKTKVISPYFGGNKQIYEVHFSNGEVIETDDDHLWYVEPSFSSVGKRDNRKPWKCGKFLSTKDLYNNPEYKFIPVNEPLNFEKKELLIDPWKLGYWLGNGTSDKFEICCSNSDTHLFDNTDFTSRSEKGKGCTYFYFSKMLPILRELNLIKNKHIPLCYLFSSIDQRKCLLAGLMDSDGTVSNSGQCVYDSNNFNLIKDVKILIESLGLKCSLTRYSRDDKNMEYRLFFTAKGWSPFSLERKTKLIRLNDRPIRHKITNIVKTERKEDVYCISIENEDKLFLVGKSFIPTHNTIFCLNHIINKALQNNLRNPQYAYIAPTYRQAKRIAWDPLQEYARHLPGFDVNKQELTVMIRRFWLPDPDVIKIMLLGSDQPDTLRGLYLDGNIFDEFAQCDPIVWGEVVRPALSDRKGWSIFIGTPKGQNHFHRIYEQGTSNEDWFTCIYKASETGIIDDEELSQMRREMDPSEYEQEMECSFNAAIRGSYFGAIIEKLEDNGRVGDFVYDPSLPVDTYWDLGMHDAMAVWFRQRLPGEEYKYIDYFEANGKTIPEICKIIKERPYAYGRHVLPWDANVKNLETGRTRLEVARKHLKGVEIQKRQTVDDRIQASRILLPKCLFNREKCSQGLKALRNYQKEWDSKAEIFKNKPLHDWCSHASDSFGYSALDNRQSFFYDNRYESLPRTAEHDYNELGDY